MKVERLTLRNFRNIRETSFSPDAHLNFLLGSNGQGKTSALEALSYLSTLRSFRGSKSAEVIHYGDNFGEIICDVVPEISTPELSTNVDMWKTQLRIIFSMTDSVRQKATKTAFINGKAYRSSTSYLSQRFGSFELGFHAIVFNPSDHDLVRGEPALRRSYLDRVLTAEDVEYLRVFQKYQRILEQRNALLKSLEKPAPDLLAGFTEPMAQAAAFITLRRLQWIERLAKRLDDIMRHIAPSQPHLRLLYTTNWAPECEEICIGNNDLTTIHFAGQGHLASLELLEQAFWKKLALMEAAEWRARSSLVGPHRDDWAFFQGDQVLKGHGSQGEVRSALLALKLAEIELFREQTGHRPLFLLDDFSSELDQERRAFLLKFLSETDLQVFVTTTDQAFLAVCEEDLKGKGKRFSVSDGNITES